MARIFFSALAILSVVGLLGLAVATQPTFVTVGALFACAAAAVAAVARLRIAEPLTDALSAFGALLLGAAKRGPRRLIEAAALLGALVTGRGLAPGLSRRIIYERDADKIAAYVKRAGGSPGLHVVAADERGALLHALTDAAVSEKALAAHELQLVPKEPRR